MVRSTKCSFIAVSCRVFLFGCLRSLLIGPRSHRAPKHKEPLHTRSSVCGQKKLIRPKHVWWLLLYNPYFTRGVSLLRPFMITASDVERKAVYAMQGGRADLLRVCEQTTTSTPQAQHSFLLLNRVKPKDHKKALVCTQLPLSITKQALSHWKSFSTHSVRQVKAFYLQTHFSLSQSLILLPFWWRVISERVISPEISLSCALINTSEHQVCPSLAHRKEFWHQLFLLNSSYLFLLKMCSSTTSI